MKLNKGNKRGISLIVLVITIIVMIILAAAIILSLNSSGIIGKANKAKLSADKANMLEAAGVAYAEYQLEKQMGELEDPNQTAEDYVKDKLGNQFTADTLNQLSVLDDGTIQALPIIPEGFIMSPYAGEQKISDGLVIYEAETLENVNQATAMETYNQYVWVPVPDVNEFKLVNWLEEDNFETFVEPLTERINLLIDIIEIDISDYKNEIDQYNSMKESVEKNGGFYIARYESGKETIDGVEKTISKKDANVWNNIAWDAAWECGRGELDEYIYTTLALGDDSQDGAAKISKDIISYSNAVRHLIYGVQWDATLNFMKDVDNPHSTTGKKYIYDSTGMGWYNDNKSGNVEHKTGIDIGENALNKVKNIYDMAGNVLEWTYEVRVGTDYSSRMSRGGADYIGGIDEPACSRITNFEPSYNAEYIGFRMAMYIK